MTQIVLSNSSGEAESSAALNVNKGANAPKILKPLEDQVPYSSQTPNLPYPTQIVAKGTPLVFEVKIGGEPTDVKWLKDGVPLSASDKIKIDKVR